MFDTQYNPNDWRTSRKIACLRHISFASVISHFLRDTTAVCNIHSDVKTQEHWTLNWTLHYTVTGTFGRMLFFVMEYVIKCTISASNVRWAISWRFFKYVLLYYLSFLEIKYFVRELEFYINSKRNNMYYNVAWLVRWISHPQYLIIKL